MFRQLFFIILVLFISHKSYADELNLQLSNDSLRLIYAAEVFGGSFGPTDLEMAGYYNRESDTILHLGLLIRNDTLDNPLIIRIGTRFYYVDAGNQPGQASVTASALTFGGELLYVPDAFNGFGVGFAYFVSPTVTTFQDADGFTEYSVIVNYSVSETTGFYVGYRNIELKLDNASDVEVEAGFMFGFRLLL